MELLVVVAVLGVITAIGIPMYSGYLANSKLEVAKNNLRLIHAAQLELKSDTGRFCTPTDCASTSLINTNLFGGQQTLDPDFDYSFSVTNASGGSSFNAKTTDGASTCTIDQTGSINC